MNIARIRNLRSLGALLGGMLVILVAALGVGRSDAAVIYVTQNGAGAKTGATWDQACGEAEFRTALASSSPGTDFWVAKGTYTPGTNRTDSFVLKSGVGLYGGFPASLTGAISFDRNPTTNVTTLSGNIDDPATSADNSYHVVTGSGADATAVLDGFTIAEGNADSSDPDDSGAGMYNESGSPVVAGCVFSGNTAYYGGGMYNYNGSNPRITNCRFSANTSVYDGGGMYNHTNSNPTVTRCTFSNNATDGGGSGGGMINYSGSNPTVTNCAFSGNSASFGAGMINDGSSPTIERCAFSMNVSDNTGGGVYNFGGSTPTITDCTFSNNTAASFGGGMCNHDDSSPSVTNCTFSGNNANDFGGGMSNSRYSSPSVTNCTFFQNTATTCGGAMFDRNNSNPVVTNCTFFGNTAANTGGVMWNEEDSAPAVTNCIFWNDSEEELSGDCAPTVVCCVVQGGYTGGTDIISDDPILGDLGSNGGPTWTCALSPDSSAIDRGLPVGTITVGGVSVTVPGADQRGVTRPQGISVDIGAYEFVGFSPSPTPTPTPIPPAPTTTPTPAPCDPGMLPSVSPDLPPTGVPNPPHLSLNEAFLRNLLGASADLTGLQVFEIGSDRSLTCREVIPGSTVSENQECVLFEQGNVFYCRARLVWNREGRFWGLPGAEVTSASTPRASDSGNRTVRFRLVEGESCDVDGLRNGVLVTTRNSMLLGLPRVPEPTISPETGSSSGGGCSAGGGELLFTLGVALFPLMLLLRRQ